MNAAEAQPLGTQRSFYHDFFANFRILDDSTDRIETVAHLFAKYKGKIVLEAGCGNGDVSGAIYEDDMLLTGIDIWRYDRALENKRKWHGYEFALCSVCALPFKADAFDTVVYSEVIEHLLRKDQKLSIEELSRCLCPGGVMVISTPNPWSLQSVWNRVVKKVRRGESSYGNQPIEEWLNPRELRKLVRLHFEIIERGGSWYWIPLLERLGLGYAAGRISKSLKTCHLFSAFGLYQYYVLRNLIK